MPFNITFEHGGDVYHNDGVSDNHIEYNIPVDYSSCSELDTIFIAVTDHNGCVAFDTAAFVVGDIHAPVIEGTLPDVTITCMDQVPGEIGDLNDLVNMLEGRTTSITDNCTNFTELQLENELISTEDPCNQTMQRIYSIIDACGNVAQISQNIILNDNVPPVVTGAIPDMTVTCAADTTPAILSFMDFVINVPEVSVTDNCTPQDQMTLSVVTEPFTALCNHTYHRTYTFTDACGNSSDIIQNIILNDQTNPTITGTLDDVTIYANADCSYDLPANMTFAELEAAGLTITDCNLSQEVTATDDNTDALDECRKTIVRTYTIYDSCGNSSTITQNIFVEDTIAPAVTDNLNDTTVYYTDVLCNYPTVPELTLSDFEVSDCNEVSFTVTNRDTTNNGQGCEWSFTRVYSFTDACNNGPTVIEQQITIQDTARPYIENGLNDITVYLSAACESSYPDTLTIAAMRDSGMIIADCNLDEANVGIAHSTPEDLGNCVSRVIRTYTIFDLCGHSNSFTQVIETRDTTPPQITGTLPDQVV